MIKEYYDEANPRCYMKGWCYMKLTLETTMMSGIQLILYAILLKETVKRNTGNIIYTTKGLTNHISYLMIDP